MKEKFDINAFPAPDAEELDFIRQCLPDGEGLDRFLERCTTYGKFLYTTNETMNLTRIPPSDFWSKHVCDAVSILRELPDLCGGGALCDLGCGAGIPSIILAAAVDELEITAMDSTRKKVDFVQQAAEKCGLLNLHTVHGRANELARKDPYYQGFDFVTARAVADALTLITESTNLLVPKEGRLLIYRTESQAEPERELLRKKRAKFYTTEEFTLPHDAGSRMFMVLEDLKLKQGK